MSDYLETLEVDSTGDLIINELNKPDMVSASDKVKQDLRILLKTHKGEHPDNPDFGVDWLRIKQSGMKEQVIRAELTRALKLYPWLKSIEEISIGEPDSNRQLKIEVKIITSADEQVSVGVTA